MTRTSDVPQDALSRVVAGEMPLNIFIGLGRREIDAIAVLAGNLYLQGQTADAQKLFEGLVALDGSLHYGYAGLGAIALREKRLDEALEQLRQAAKCNPEDPTISANMGEALLRLGRFDEATEHFGNALALDPEEKDPGANRARAIIDGMMLAIREEGSRAD